MTNTTTLFQKMGLLLFALGVTFLFLEVGLRLGAGVFLFLQDRGNRLKITQASEYRIMCLGESTTALGGEDSYPRQLERILNQKQNKIRFKVINKGVPATTTDQILARAEGYLKQYQSQMIVAMMGVNDPQNLQAWTWRDNLARYSKAFKLLDMIVRHLTARKKENALTQALEQQIAQLERQPVAPVTVAIAKANLYRSANRPQQERAAINTILELEPQNPQGWMLLGIYFERHADYPNAIDAFQKVIAVSTGDIQLRAMERIAQNSILINQKEAVFKIYSEILRLDPRNPGVNEILGDLALEKKELSRAIKFYEQQLKVNPLSKEVYGRLAKLYRQNGQQEMAERILEQGVRRYPDDPEMYSQWGYDLKENQRYEEAIKAFAQSLENNKGNIRGANQKIYQGLMECELALHRPAKAAVCKKRMEKQANDFNPQTRENYLKLARIAAQKKIILLAVQYPYRPIQPLRDMLSSESGVILVDNQQIFAEAIDQHGYDALFRDRFAGDFGHCSALGNAILAENIAKTILQMIVQ